MRVRSYVTAECPHFPQSRGLGLMYYVRAEYPPPPFPQIPLMLYRKKS
jgi:hypothetical protein